MNNRTGQGQTTTKPKDRPSLRYHDNESHHCSWFKCIYCKLTAKYKNSIVFHSKQKHPDLPPQIVTLTNSPIEDKTDAFNCMYCNCTALNLNYLKDHWTATHKVSGLNFMFRKTNIHSELEYECFWCKKRSDIKCLVPHCETEHPDQHLLVVSITVPKYKCSECKLVFNSVDILKRHFSMDHPSKQFCYLVINTQKPPSVIEKSLLSTSNQGDYKQSKRNPTYKCFSCHFVSSMFWPMVKHMHRHFVTYVCTECDSLYPSAFGIRSHMYNKHPGSDVKPLVLKGSDKDIENAKRNIIIITESGIKRKITEEELTQAEKEEKIQEQSLEMYSYDEPLGMKGSFSPFKETARKSTGSPSKHHLASPQRPQGDHISPRLQRVQNKPNRGKRKRPSWSSLFVTVSSRGKNIKLPVDTLQKLVNFEVQLPLDNDSVKQT